VRLLTFGSHAAQDGRSCCFYGPRSGTPRRFRKLLCKHGHRHGRDVAATVILTLQNNG